MQTRHGKPVGKHRHLRGHLLPMVLVLGFSVLLLAAVVAVKHYLSNPRNLPIKTMAIKGKFRHLDRENLRRVMSKAIDGGFFTTDIQRIRQAGLSLPWVDEVSITRVWPDQLVMEVTEQTPVARWGEKALVNGRGQVFYPIKPMRKWPELRLWGADEKAPAVLDFYAGIKTGLAARGLQIRSLALDERAEWKIKLDNGLQIVLSTNDALDRLQRFLKLYGEISGKELKPVRVDLRYEQGFAVGWQDQDAGTGPESGA